MPWYNGNSDELEYKIDNYDPSWFAHEILQREVWGFWNVKILCGKFHKLCRSLYVPLCLHCPSILDILWYEIFPNVFLRLHNVCKFFRKCDKCDLCETQMYVSLIHPYEKSIKKLIRRIITRSSKTRPVLWF